jgi:hypothetical protein
LYIFDNTHVRHIPPINTTRTMLKNRWYKINLNCRILTYRSFYITYESFSTVTGSLHIDPFILHTSLFSTVITGWYCVSKKPQFSFVINNCRPQPSYTYI